MKETLVIGAALFCIVLLIVVAVIDESHKPHHPDFDWTGECGDKSGYWYEYQSHTSACIKSDGSVSTCTNNTKVFQKDMTEGEFTKYCLKGKT